MGYLLAKSGLWVTEHTIAKWQLLQEGKDEKKAGKGTMTASRFCDDSTGFSLNERQPTK